MQAVGEEARDPPGFETRRGIRAASAAAPSLSRAAGTAGARVEGLGADQGQSFSASLAMRPSMVSPSARAE